MSYKTLLVRQDGDITIATFNRPPANAINMQVCSELVALVDALERDDSQAGLVLTGRAGMFSAGLDIIALRKLNRDMMKVFWGRFCEAFLRLYTTPLATAAAISGHAPAGGCVMSLACDYRVMAEGDYKIGLNEVAVGLPVPTFLCQVHAATVGQRAAERLLPQGTMLSPEGALVIGLVDAVVEQKQVLPLALKETRHRLQVPPIARAQTKRNLRAPLADSMRAAMTAEVEALTDGWLSEECERVMSQLIEKLQARSSGLR